MTCFFRAGPSTYKHRAEFAKQPSVVSWNVLNLNRKVDDAEAGEIEEDMGGANWDGDNTNGKSKKRRDATVSEMSNSFSTSYDWSYRENHLSRTAKKAARISLTTDTIEMMTCGLEGLDDRYDGSGWTTWKKKDNSDGKKKKYNKDGTEKQPRKPQPRQPKAPGDPLAMPKTGGNLPRWCKGMPRCPDVLLPKEEDIVFPTSKPAEVGEEQVALVAENTDVPLTALRREGGGKSAEGKRAASINVTVADGDDAIKSGVALVGAGTHTSTNQTADFKMESADASSAPNVDDKKQEQLDKTSYPQIHASAIEPQPNHEGEESSDKADIKEDQGSAQSESTEMEDDKDKADSPGIAASVFSLLPIPTVAQMAAANLTVSDSEPLFFKLPYMAVRHKFQKEFEDYACGDRTSEFPTPFVPLNKNEYVDEEAACRLPVHEGKNICQCIFVPGTPETACGEQSNCLLRDIYIECGDRCPCGNHCLNKRLRKRQWAKCRYYV